jgi:radical SAM protein with 4Fe4S-binding SPASM domain
LPSAAVAVSLDASNAELHDRIRGRAGAFEKSCRFIDRALEQGLPMSVITTIHKMNLRELPAMREMLLDRGIAWQVQIAGTEGCRFPKEFLIDEEEFYSVGMFIAATRKKYPVSRLPVTGAHDMGFYSMMLDDTSVSPDWTGCQAGLSVLGIHSNGHIKGCLAMQDSTIEGNCRDVSVYDLWNSDTAFPYSRRFDTRAAGDNCRDCEHLESCRGGCNEMSFMKTGRLHNDPYCFCRIEKRLFREELKNPLNRLKIKAKKRIRSMMSAVRN